MNFYCTYCGSGTTTEVFLHRRDFYICTHKTSRRSKQMSDRKSIVTANNESVPIEKFIFVYMHIGDREHGVKFYLVPNLEPTLIIGINFLKKHKAVIDLGNKTVTLDPRRQLVLESNVTIPPRSEVVTIARIKGSRLPDNIIGLSSESPNLSSHGLLAGKVMSTVEKGRVLHRLCNISDHPVTLKRNSSVGKFVCISDRDKVFSVRDSSPAVREAGEARADGAIPCVKGRDLTDAEIKELNGILREYGDVFVDKSGKLGQCDMLKHEIKIPSDQRPIRQRPYKMGAKQKQILETMVTEMIDDGIIEPSVSPWGAPCLLIAKQNKNDFRFVVDYRQLNKCTEFDAHALPTTEDALETLGSSQPTFFSTLDLKSGFYQVEIDEKSRPYTAWRCHMGSNQFRRLPMGLKNSPATFQRLMETVLRGINFKFCLI